MTIESNPKEPFASIAQEIDSSRSDVSTACKLYIFFSFDLVGSTEFKDREDANWVDIWKTFYMCTPNILAKALGRIPTVWKYIGDEVLLYVEVDENGLIATSVTAAHNSMRDIHSSLVATYPLAKSLSIKSTIWMSPVSTEDGSSPITINHCKTGFKDRKIDIETPGGVSCADFIGPNIDIGFRIAKYSTKWIVTVSANIAHALLNERAFPRDGMRIVDLKPLKGVLKGAAYPIIWFRNSWAEDRVGSDYALQDEYNMPLLLEVLRHPTSIENLARLKQDWIEKGIGGHHLLEMDQIDVLISTANSIVGQS